MSEISASVINSLVGEAPFVKCPDVQVLTEKTAVEMENVTVQIISASVYQVGKGKHVLCCCEGLLWQDKTFTDTIIYRYYVTIETALKEKQFRI